MANWQTHAASFDARLTSLLSNATDSEEIFRRIPAAPFSVRLTEREWVHYNSFAALLCALRSVQELEYSFVESFRRGLFVAASLASRALVELSGVPPYIKSEIITKYEQDPSNKAVIERLERLNKGANGVLPLWWGDASTLQPVNAMEFVRAADATGDYDWLCNSTHPSLLHHSYLYMAGRFGDNWSNNSFAKHGITVLERLVSITETAAIRVRTTTSSIVKDSEPILMTLS